MFEFEDVKKCSMSKVDMWNELNGKKVECITRRDGEFQLFAVKDIETDKLYILDDNADYI